MILNPSSSTRLDTKDTNNNNLNAEILKVVNKNKENIQEDSNSETPCQEYNINTKE